MDIRENIEDFEEVIRAAVTGMMKNIWTAMPAQVTQDSADGHVSTAQPTIKRAITDPTTGQVTYEDHPIHVDVPIHHMGGGGVSVTHPNKKGDTGAILYAARGIDPWFQSDGSQQPIDDRMHSLADGFFLSGIRSIPRKLMQVSQTSTQTRTDDKKSVIDHGPSGTHHKTVDPGTAAASENFDPFSQATKFFEHILHPSNGHAVNATDGGTTHGTSLDHTNGFKAQASNGAHSVAAHPTNGVGIASTIAHTIAAPNANLDKSGNLSTKQNITSASGNISAPSGSVSGMTGGFGALTGLGGGPMQLIQALAGIFGSLSASGTVQGAQVQATGTVQGAMLQSTASYTVETLPVPSMALQGTRATVTDAVSPTFAQLLQGGGSTICPAWCDGTQWIAA